jgi:hypothetical protein
VAFDFSYRPQPRGDQGIQDRYRVGQAPGGIDPPICAKRPDLNASVPSNVEIRESRWRPESLWRRIQRFGTKRVGCWRSFHHRNISPQAQWRQLLTHFNVSGAVLDPFRRLVVISICLMGPEHRLFEPVNHWNCGFGRRRCAESHRSGQDPVSHSRPSGPETRHKRPLKFDWSPIWNHPAHWNARHNKPST